MQPTEYVYLLQEVEFIKSGEPIYKIGKTRQENTKRISGYPKGSVLLLQIKCKGCDIIEKEIKTLFIKKYEQYKTRGIEYFRGNAEEMRDDIYKLCTQPDYSSGVLPNLGLQFLSKLSEKNSIYRCLSDVLIKNTKIWEHNRPPDSLRIKEIAKRIEIVKYVEGWLWLAKRTFQETAGEAYNYICYDGQHRLEALKVLAKENKYFPVIVHISCNFSDEEIAGKFEAINKAVPVSLCYTENTKIETQDIKSIVECLVNKMCKEWPNCVSSSKYPKRPNFNIDVINNSLYQFLKDYLESNTNTFTSDSHNSSFITEKLWNAMLTLNKKYESELLLNEYPKTVWEKAQKNKFFLFLKDFTHDLQL